MAVNGGVNQKDFLSHTESGWFDPTEEAYESFENISPCKKEDLQSPAVAGHGVFHPVMKIEQGTVYDETMSMLIINAADYPTQLEVSNADAVEVPIEIQVEPPSEEEITNGSLANSTVSSVSLADAALSEMDPLETLVPKPLQMIGLEALPIHQESVSTHFPKNFLVSAESTPLKPYEHNIVMTKGYLHDYLRGNPMTYPIGEMDDSLELGTEVASVLLDPSACEIAQSEVLEIQTSLALRTSFVSDYDQDREDSDGESTVPLDITPTKAKQPFQEPNAINEYTGETDSAEGNSEDMSLVIEKPKPDQIPVERLYSEQDIPFGEECDYDAKIQKKKYLLSTEEASAVKPEEHCVKLGKVKKTVHSTGADHTAAKIDRPPDCKEVPDVRRRWQTAMTAGPKTETEGKRKQLK